MVQSVDNVIVANCTVGNFAGGGIIAQNSRSVNINNFSVSGGSIGILLNETKDSVITEGSVNGTTSYGIDLTNSNGDRLLYNQFS